MTDRPIVITGLGIVSPIGIGAEAVVQSLDERLSGVAYLAQGSTPELPTSFGGQVLDFNPRAYIRPRKSMKVMSRDLQLAFAAADLAWQDAELDDYKVDPDRVGVVFGADMIYCDLDEIAPAIQACVVNGKFDYSLWGKEGLDSIFPLWMLKYLPNMSASHVAIAHDARGPNNSILVREVSCLLAIAEGMRLIRRGRVDVVISGGASNRTHTPIVSSRGGHPASQRYDAPAAACRPFDMQRDGMVRGEGGAAVILESAEHALRRKRKPLATVLGDAIFHGRREQDPAPRRVAIEHSIREVLKKAGVTPKEVGQINAHGISTVVEDVIEAQAIANTMGDTPVTALKSYFGALGAAGGIVELVAGLLAARRSVVPATLNYESPDPACPVNASSQSRPAASPIMLKLNQGYMGQAASLLLRAEPE